MGYIRMDDAITEVLSSIILLMIAVVVFAAGAIVVMNSTNAYADDAEPVVTIVGSIQGTNIVLDHVGGNALSVGTTEVTFTVDGSVSHGKISDNNWMNYDAKFNGKWNIGEQVVYPSVVSPGKRIQVTVVDTQTNTVIMTGVLQTGTENTEPEVVTNDATLLTSHSARIHLQYDFHQYTASLSRSFSYKKTSASVWINTPWVDLGSQSGNGYEDLSGLDIATEYTFKGKIRYLKGGTLELLNGSEVTFTTYDDIVGQWFFEEGSGTVVADSSGYNNNGDIQGASFVPPGHSNLGSYALQFDGVDDTVTVNDATSLDVTDRLSLEAWVKPFEDSSVGFFGQIQEHQTSVGYDLLYEPDILFIRDNLYAVAFRTKDCKGVLQTVEISADGIIQTQKDEYNFITDKYVEPDIALVYGNIYVVVWGVPDGSKILVTTVEIDTIGKITLKKETFLPSGDYGREPSIISVGSSAAEKTFAVSCGGGLEKGGWLVTFSVKNDGSIVQFIQSQSFNMKWCSKTAITRVGKSSYYAVVYGNEDVDAVLRTFYISTYGEIMPRDSFQFRVFSAGEPDICYVIPSSEGLPSTIYAIAFGPEEGYEGFVYAIKINNDGTIIKNILDYAYLGSSACYEPSITAVGTELIAISYGGGSKNGVVITIQIPDGVVYNPIKILDTKTFTSGGFSSAIIIKEKSTAYCRCLMVHGVGQDVAFKGFCSTIKVLLTNNRKVIISKQSSYELWATDSKVYASLNGYQLCSADIVTNQWNFIVFTLTPMASTFNVHLYVNDSLKASGSFSGTLQHNANPVVIGGLKGIIDEVTIYRRTLTAPDIHNHYIS